MFADFVTAIPFTDDDTLGNSVRGFSADRIVEIGIEFLSDAGKFADTHFLQSFVKLGDDHGQTLLDGIQIVGFFSGSLRHAEEVGNTQERSERIGNGMSPGIADVTGGTTAEILIFSLEIEKFRLLLGELGLELIDFRNRLGRSGSGSVFGDSFALVKNIADLLGGILRCVIGGGDFYEKASFGFCGEKEAEKIRRKKTARLRIYMV